MSYISAIKKNNDVLVWERVDGKRQIVNYRAPYYYYTKSDNGTYTSIYGDKLERHDFATGKEFIAAKMSAVSAGQILFESDISPDLKILSEHYYGVAAPTLHITFYDIENDYDLERGYASIDDPYAPINSLALYNNWENRMVLYSVPPPNYDGPIDGAELLEELAKKAPLPTDCTVEVNICVDESELLKHFLDEIEDSDVISGWNSHGFDDPYTAKRLERMGKRFLNRLSFPDSRSPRFKTELNSFNEEQTVVDIYGRIAADYLKIFKKYEVTERPSFKLEAIADEILIDKETGESTLSKLEYVGSLAHLYHTDFIMFMRYNLRDTEILKGFEERLGYIDIANQMVHMSTGLFQHVTGTIKLADLATVNYCHHEMNGIIVNDVTPPDTTSKAKGAFVLIPQIGEHDWIGSIDIKSLYPSVIRSLNLSPETIVGQFLEEEEAFDAINDNSSKILSLKLESGDIHKVEASDWKSILKEKGWAISGFGTVFSQNKQGIMPAILNDWYDKRQHFQELKQKCLEANDKAQALYYDKTQYIYKIKLNSYYGSLLNAYFRFYDKRLGESTTATSRAILLHQCAKVTELLDGEYTLPDASRLDKNDKTHIGYSKKWSVIYGDSVASDSTLILENGGECKISQMFKTVDEQHSNGKEYYFPTNMKTLTYDESQNKTIFDDVLYVMRHKTTKKMFRVWLTNTIYVDVTEDHSLIGYKNTEQRSDGESVLFEIKPQALEDGTNSLIHLTGSDSAYDFAITHGTHKIEEIEYDDYVYDIEVGNTHMFFANSVLVHNTDSSYFTTHGKTQEQATVIADTVATEVDKSFPAFMRDTFLCGDDFAINISTARENITSKGIFIDKKRYVLRVVDNDGFLCDKLKIMGVELKKTTLPKHISKKLTTFIEQYLKGATWEELAADIVEYKELLYNTSDVLLIGLPKGITKLEQYTHTFNNQDPNNKISIPGHVAAAIHYNKCLDLYGDKESMKITSGMKIKVFYLQTMIGKFKSIALPTDIQQVPQWFFDNFNINRKMHIERLVDKPLSNIIKAIDKTVPSKQSMSDDSLLGF